MIDLGAVRRLRIIGLVEGCTLLALVGIAVPLKYLAGWPHGTTLLGPVHGIAFTLYVVAAVQAIAAGGFSPREALRVFLVSILPAGPFWNDTLLKRKLAAATTA